MTRAADPRCRCHSRRKTRRCCGPIHAGRPARLPVDLMRARYAAYALGFVQFVIETTDPDGPVWEPDTTAWRVGITRFCAATRFLGLRVFDAPPPSADPGQGEAFVTFVATLEQAGQDASFGERSRFTRTHGLWRYHSGERLSENVVARRT